MKIIVDSREKPEAIKGILAYFDKHEIQYEIRKLETGDYMLEDNPNIVVDRKRGLNELAQNLLSPDRARFYREVRRAKADGIKLYILCEHGKNVKRIEDVADWTPKYGKVTGKWLREAIYRCAIAYGVEFIFCDKRNTGKRIVEILTNGGGENNDG